MFVRRKPRQEKKASGTGDAVSRRMVARNMVAVGEEEEEETFQIDRAKQKATGKLFGGEAPVPLFQRQTGEYSAERLIALKANNKFVAPSSPSSPLLDEDSDPMFDSPLIQTLPLDTMEEDDAISSIQREFIAPTTHAIAQAKLKRERARRQKGEVGDDYVSLESGAGLGSQATETPSRIVREEMVEGDEDPFEELRATNVLRFGDPGQEKERSRLSHMMDNDDIMDEEEDADSLAWEKQQLQKMGFSDQPSFSADQSARGSGARLGSSDSSSALLSAMDSIRDQIQKISQQRL